jgi:hypothetical protein
VLGVAGETPIRDETGPWPSIEALEPEPLPLVLAGSGVSAEAEIPTGTRLDAVAPTLAEIMGLRRPHPGVRSGEAIPDVASGERPRLIVIVALKGISSADLERRPDAWPTLMGLIRNGAATMQATAGSLPEEPTAALSTVGTGALPRDHGVTGRLLLNDEGNMAEAWTAEAPFSIVAALGDDLDEVHDQESEVGLVGNGPADRGLIGRDWYVEHDRDDVVFARTPELVASAADRLLASGYGADPSPDLLGIAMEGPLSQLDSSLGTVLSAADAASGSSFVVAVTGTAGGGGAGGTTAAEIEAELGDEIDADVVEGAGSGGFFLDQDELTDAGLTDDRIVAALRGLKTLSGEPMLADVFPAIAVTFARYC